MHFSPYAIPAIIALLCKVGMFYYARRSKIHNLQTKLYLWFLFCMSIQNLLEIRFFVEDGSSVQSPLGISGTLYFALSILAIAFLLHLALVTAASWKSPEGNLPLVGLNLVYLPALVLEALLLSSPLLVSGFERMGYTYTRTPGPLFFLWEIYSVGYLCGTAALFFYGARKQSTRFRRLQNRWLLVGLIPIVVVVLAVVGLQHIGIRSFNATATLPVAITIFLAATAYATHQHRLFDIDFFIPWSKVRKRKTAFYGRIQNLIAEVADMGSVQKIIESISGALRCPVALVGGPTPSLALAGDAFGIARFPLDELKKIDHIVVANEISAAKPQTYALMKRHKVAAIVPFHAHSQSAASWMLLGDAFSEQVYTPLDFKTVENLFARLADHFLDNQLLLRSQLLEARREMDALHTRLASAWEQIETLRRQLAETRAENQQTAPHDATARSSFDEQVAEYEARLIAKTMDHCGGNVSRAAELLGLSIGTLHDKLRQMANRESDPPEPQVLFV